MRDLKHFTIIPPVIWNARPKQSRELIRFEDAESIFVQCWLDDKDHNSNSESDEILLPDLVLTELCHDLDQSLYSKDLQSAFPFWQDFLQEVSFTFGKRFALKDLEHFIDGLREKIDKLNREFNSEKEEMFSRIVL